VTQERLQNLQRLLENFREQEKAHESMLEIMDQSELGLREGCMEQLVESCRQQQCCALLMQRLDEQRVELTQICVDRKRDAQRSVPGIEDLIAAAPDDLGRNLQEVVDRLRPLAQQTRMRCAVIRSAVAALSRHFSSLLQGVHGMVGRAGTYGRLGTMSRGNQLEFNVDLQS
jgi:hypothetical protein